MSVPRVAINGFGRIGRLTFRAFSESRRNDIEIVAVNELAPVETSAHLLKYDSVHGTFPLDVDTEGKGLLVVDGKKFPIFQERDPQNLPWKDLGVDIVMDCTGLFTKRADVEKHLNAGARKVLISAPATDEDLTVVFGVNSNQLKAEHIIVSNASCTTNCLAPVAYAIDNEVGIESGIMTTIHSFTGDQRIVDTAHSDLHRARAGSLNIIPTSTGAAKAVGKVLPQLNGKLHGTSMRVPTPNVSVVDFNFIASRDTSVEEVNEVIKSYANGKLKGVLGTYTAPLVSSDFNHNPLSSIFALNETMMVGDRHVRVLTWYDNEWGFSNRMSDTAARMDEVGYEP